MRFTKAFFHLRNSESKQEGDGVIKILLRISLSDESG
jgi:hypothetical protein